MSALVDPRKPIVAERQDDKAEEKHAHAILPQHPVPKTMPLPRRNK